MIGNPLSGLMESFLRPGESFPSPFSGAEAKPQGHSGNRNDSPSLPAGTVGSAGDPVRMSQAGQQALEAQQFGRQLQDALLGPPEEGAEGAEGPGPLGRAVGALIDGVFGDALDRAFGVVDHMMRAVQERLGSFPPFDDFRGPPPLDRPPPDQTRAPMAVGAPEGTVPGLEGPGMRAVMGQVSFRFEAVRMQIGMSNGQMSMSMERVSIEANFSFAHVETRDGNGGRQIFDFSGTSIDLETERSGLFIAAEDGDQARSFAARLQDPDGPFGVRPLIAKGLRPVLDLLQPPEEDRQAHRHQQTRRPADSPFGPPPGVGRSPHADGPEQTSPAHRALMILDAIHSRLDAEEEGQQALQFDLHLGYRMAHREVSAFSAQFSHREYEPGGEPIDPPQGDFSVPDETKPAAPVDLEA